MTAATKANDWVEYMVEGANLGTDQFTLVLSNTAPGSESSNPLSDGNGVVANITQVAYTYASSRDFTTSSSAQTSGTHKTVLADLTLSASGGAVGPFRYAYVIDNTLSGDPVVCVYDYGSSITLADGEDMLFDMSAANGFIQVA